MKILNKNEKITIKQKKFADLYIETGNATQSYIDAGYKATSREVAESNARKVLGKYSVSLYIKERMEEMDNKKIASQTEVLQYLTGVMRGEIKDQFDLDASLQDRTKAAELLGKRWGTFVEKKELEANIHEEITVSLEDDDE